MRLIARILVEVRREPLIVPHLYISCTEGGKVKGEREKENSTFSRNPISPFPTWSKKSFSHLKMTIRYLGLSLRRLLVLASNLSSCKWECHVRFEQKYCIKSALSRWCCTVSSGSIVYCCFSMRLMRQTKTTL